MTVKGKRFEHQNGKVEVAQCVLITLFSVRMFLEATGVMGKQCLDTNVGLQCLWLCLVPTLEFLRLKLFNSFRYASFLFPLIQLGKTFENFVGFSIFIDDEYNY